MDVSKIMATVCWYEAYRRERRARSAHALERKSRPQMCKARPDGAGVSTSGLYARYARGDSSPPRTRYDELFFQAPDAMFWLEHQLFHVLRVQGAERMVGFDAGTLDCRIYVRELTRDKIQMMRPLTPRLLRAIVTQGDADALAALIALQEISRNELELEIAAAIAQCAVFACMDPELKPIRTVLVARLRQVVLDHVRSESDDRLAMDRYDVIGLSDEVLKLLRNEGLPDARRVRRSLLRQVLDGTFDTGLSQRLQVPIRRQAGQVDDPCARQPFPPRAIVLERETRAGARGSRPGGFGKTAVAILKRTLGEYWVD